MASQSKKMSGKSVQARKTRFALIWWIDSDHKDVIPIGKLPADKRMVGAEVSLWWKNYKTKKTSKCAAKIIAISHDDRELSEIILNNKGEIMDPSCKIFSASVIQQKKQMDGNKKLIKSVRESNNKRVNESIKQDNGIFEGNTLRNSAVTKKFPLQPQPPRSESSSSTTSQNLGFYRPVTQQTASQKFPPATPPDSTRSKFQVNIPNLQESIQQPTPSTSGALKIINSVLQSSNDSYMAHHRHQSMYQHLPHPTESHIARLPHSEHQMSQSSHGYNQQMSITQPTTTSHQLSRQIINSREEVQQTSAMSESVIYHSHQSDDDYDNNTDEDDDDDNQQEKGEKSVVRDNVDEEEDRQPERLVDAHIKSNRSEDYDWTEEDIGAAARSMASLFPIKVSKAQIYQQTILLRALQYSYEADMANNANQAINFEIPKKFFENSNDKKEIGQHSKFFLPLYMVAVIEKKLASASPEKKWKVLTREVLIQVYGNHLGSFSAKGSKTNSRPGINRKLFTGIFEWIEEICETVPEIDVYIKYINKLISNRRRSSVSKESCSKEKLKRKNNCDMHENTEKKKMRIVDAEPIETTFTETTSDDSPQSVVNTNIHYEPSLSEYVYNGIHYSHGLQPQDYNQEYALNNAEYATYTRLE